MHKIKITESDLRHIIAKNIFESLNGTLKPKLTILWLDDMRDPYKYFSKKSSTGAFVRNKAFYDELNQGYDIDYVWVKNIDEFTNYILQNGLPEFVSFDHDLGKGLPKGLDCANWLISYCKKTGQNLPKFYVHSANPNGQVEINAALNNALNEARLNAIITEAIKKTLNW